MGRFHLQGYRFSFALLTLTLQRGNRVLPCKLLVLLLLSFCFACKSSGVVCGLFFKINVY